MQDSPIIHVQQAKWLICICIAVTLSACRFAPTPNPSIERNVEPMAGIPVSGTATLMEVVPDRVLVSIGVLPDDLPDVLAEARAGDCASSGPMARLSSVAAGNLDLFEGEITGTLTSVRPMAVVLLDATTGQLIACARFE